MQMEYACDLCLGELQERELFLDPVDHSHLLLREYI